MFFKASMDFIILHNCPEFLPMLINLIMNKLRGWSGLTETGLEGCEKMRNGFQGCQAEG